MDKGRQGERYLLTGENASFKLVFDMAAIISETKKPRFSIPLCIIESYGWLLVLVSRLTGNLPLISPPVCPIALTTQFWPCYSFGVLFFFFFLSIELAIVIILLISDSILPFYEQTVHVLRHQWEYSCEKAKTELGYNPRGLEDGLKEVLPWLKSMGVIKYWGKMLVVTCVVALHGWDVN